MNDTPRTDAQHITNSLGYEIKPDDKHFQQFVDARFAHELEREADRLRREVAALRLTLNRIASWDEGEDVDGSFDEPSSAAVARMALKFSVAGVPEPAPSIKAGPYTLTRYKPGKFWLDNGEGEGMETSELKVENLLGEFFKREF